MFFVDFLTIVMQWCYSLLNNYGLAIILFTLITKIILLPISILVQKNSVKMVKMQPDVNRIHIKYFGDKDRIADEELALYKKEKYSPFLSIIPVVVQIVLLLGVVGAIKAVGEDVNLEFLGLNLKWIAVENGGLAWIAPVAAGVSALIMCVGQNMMNPLQKEQGNWNKYGMLIFSVALSLYLGAFVEVGVALYWVASNLMAVALQWILNIMINPKKYIDYKALEETNAELSALKAMSKNKEKRTQAQIKKERQDYKRFFSIGNKHLVFYSEGSGFYKYYQGIIEYILKHTNIVVHYVTSDYNDQVFEIAKKEKNLKVYYIEEKKLVTLMLKMDADVVVMTMPDLQRYHIKRSYVRKDISYIYVPHGIDSMNLTMRYKSVDYYDVVFVANEYQYEEMLATNKLHELHDRRLVKAGYPLLDDMIRGYKPAKVRKEKTILIAPSWQKDNIIELCLDELINNLKDSSYNIVVRPHPQQVRHMKKEFEELKKKYADYKNIEIQTDFSKNDTVFNADLLITDWSGIAHEYVLTTKKPVLFIDTPMKVMNPEYKELKIEPFNIWMREKIGRVLKVKDLDKIEDEISKLLKDQKKCEKEVDKLLKASYNVGKSAEFEGDYIINEISDRINKRKEKDGD